ncbi:aspartate kinase [Fusobacterium perfoetens]|uniref:aspartate kinase n=1 Tax=Fusobacterium perfoetens TaxID=852 RepID=UPI0004813026|nr:aspartate kinase [Fusobacterium perfoetens]MCI6152800.1 aspartate kinase [Fusobacterium perfoetens]MDY3236694.1 aspartate kinase [Fusobacterium perfoetens]
MRVVLKYGGSSVATIEKIKAIAEYIVNLKKTKYNEIIVVASAMGKTTNALIAMAKEISDSPNQRELDSLLSTGEQQTVSLLSMAINSLGQKAVSLTGYQANVKTVGVHTKSKIKNIDTEKIEEYLKDNNVVIVAGFQGINDHGDITTLGRGGSDTSAVALAASLKCECRIYTDVEGIYSVDPRLYKNAKFLDKISYEEMMEMANLGAGVMETRAVEIGKKYNIPIFVGKTLSETGGTWIMDMNDVLEDKLVTGISITKEIIVTTLSNINYSSEKIAKIFTIINEVGLNINMISQNVSNDNKAKISFSCVEGEKYLLDQAIERIKMELPCIELGYNDNLSMISIVGVGMINNSGVSGKFFSALSRAGINFYQVTTSEISVSCSIERKDINKAVEVVAEEFNL